MGMKKPESVKLRAYLPDGTERSHTPGRLYGRAIGPCGECLHVAACESPVDLLLRLSRCLEGPLAVLYLLVEPAGDRPAGRYQSPAPIGRKPVVAFLERYREFLEGDGRHSLWIMTVDSQDKVIYDRHEVLFAYGPLKQYERILVAGGYEPGRLAVPLPHDHVTHDHFDLEEALLLDYWPWIPFPLEPGDAL
jgi:hypothetical protein